MTGRMLRLLGVLTVVAGVFAMHGLTSHHDTTMAMPEPVMTHTEPATPHATSPMRAADPAAPHVPPAMRVADPAAPQVAPADAEHDMGGACMAVLTGLVLLLALALGLRSLLVWRAVSLPAASARFVLGERSPPPRSVRSLGVLRL
ncbi:hypothetical protein ACWF0M_29555 [Kribbella sp. NPDC055110]